MQSRHDTNILCRFFSTWYIMDIVFNTAAVRFYAMYCTYQDRFSLSIQVSPEILNIDSLLLSTFYDP